MNIIRYISKYFLRRSCDGVRSHFASVCKHKEFIPTLYCRQKLNPDLLLKLLLLGWWMLNLIQAAFTELANDEAYYWIFAQKLDWGYFDHPPMTALMIWLGNFLGGSLGVRFLFTVFQPLYLYVIWLLIRPANASAKDALLFFLIAASLPILFLYGFIAVPDGPLMMFTALFLYCFKRFATKNGWIETVALGICIAALVYSKYQAALVVLLALVANGKLMANPKTYISGLIALVLIFPHLLWQYQHDWVSFRYHLFGRNGDFSWFNIIEYLLNIIAVFNPLLFPLYLLGLKKCKFKGQTPEYRALYAITIGFTLFFLFSGLRGHIQPQWIIPISFGLIMTLFHYARNRTKCYRYVRNVGWVCLILFTIFRIELIFNPLNIQFEIFNNKRSYEQIAAISNGKPIIFGGSYAIASKYIYYTGGEAYSQANIYYRTSQWEYIDNDSDFIERDVVLETAPEYADSSIYLANGRRFSWTTLHHFQPVRKVMVNLLGSSDEIDKTMNSRGEISLDLSFENPYSYDITISPNSLPLVMALGENHAPFKEFVAEKDSFVIPAGGKISQTVRFTLPTALERKNYVMGFVLKYNKMGYWFNGKQYKINSL